MAEETQAEERTLSLCTRISVRLSVVECNIIFKY